MAEEIPSPMPGRPTFRCLREDLTSEWDDIAEHRAVLERRLVHAPFHLLSHRLIRHVEHVWPAGEPPDADRETISGLSNPPFWKAKSGRWRGAVYKDPTTGQAWLVAAGLRREGESSDFYAAFMRTATADPESLLPTAEDTDRLRLEVTEGAFTRWELTVRDAAIEAFEAAFAAGKSTFDVLGVSTMEPVLARVDIEVVTVDDGADEALSEVAVSFTRRDWSRSAVIDHAEVVVLAALNPDEQQWDVGHTRRENIYSFVGDAAEIASLASAARASSMQPGQTRPGQQAHWTHKGRLIEKSVNGEATQALCGVWFVPRQDHEGLPECSQCATTHEALKQFGTAQ